MTGLELGYRFLMRAYPPEHRANHEDEIVSTLLDVAKGEQRRPSLREAAAIVTAGLGLRAQGSSELKLGLRLAGVVALVATFAVSTMAVVFVSQWSMKTWQVPALAWFAVMAAGVFSVWATSPYRVVPPSVVAVSMIIAGSSAMGLRRSTIVPAAVFLVLSTLSRSAGRSVRSVAPLFGVVLGSAVGAFVVADLNRMFRESDSAWVYVARWDVASNLVGSNSLSFLIGCFVVALLAIASGRLRYLFAAVLLALPFLPPALIGPGRLMGVLGATETLALVGIAVAALVAAIAVVRLRPGPRSLRHAGDGP